MGLGLRLLDFFGCCLVFLFLCKLLGVVRVNFMLRNCKKTQVAAP